MAYIGREPQIGNFQVCDAISVVNNQAAYTMQVSSVNVSPETANHMLVSLNGILQAPTTSYTVSGSTITFASNLVTGDVINFIHILGSVLDLGVPSDSTVSLAKLTATGTKNSTTFLRGDNTFAAAGGTNTPRFLVHLGANQTLSDATTTLMAFATEVFDSDNAFTPTSSNYKFVVPSGKAGVYHFYSQIFFNDAGNNQQFDVYLYKNGSVFASGKERTAGNDQTVEVSAIITLAEGDRVQVYGRHNHGSNLVVDDGADLTYFYGYKLL